MGSAIIYNAPFFPLSGDGHELWRDLVALVISPVIVFSISFIVSFLIFSIRLTKLIANDEFLVKKNRLSTIEEGLLVGSGANSTIRKWESIALARSIDGFIYLVLADKKYLVIPKRAFSSENEAVNFLWMVQRKIPSKRTFNTTKIRDFTVKKKPRYYAGLIGLIPLIGTITGIVFIANGLSKYKDKWFIFIGLGGIAFNMFVFLFIFYHFNLGIKIQSAFVPYSQTQLNTVMKEVEFYKIKNGVYPDSLEQLQNDNSLSLIYDPLRNKEEVDKSCEYNYRKVGNHYYLFSSGVDGIPNTKDDFYPQIAKNDSSKFGLIRK